jgi:hypothetical protein
VVKEIVKEEIIVPVVEPVFVYAPYPVLVPAYGASYVAPPAAPVAGGTSAPPPVPMPSPGVGAPAAPSGAAATAGGGVFPGGGAGGEMTLLLAALARLEQRMGRLEERLAVLEITRPGGEGEAPPGPAARERHPAEAVLVARCFACHSPGNDKESKLVLLDRAGALVELTRKDWARVARQVEGGKMPPPAGPKNKYKIPALTAAEKAAVLALAKEKGAEGDEETHATPVPRPGVGLAGRR